MGSVYEAEQEHPRRTVALKIIKPHLASPALLRRFEQEAEALGRLQHPGIAQIHEAGTADTGFGLQPYFAMELIRGKNLREYVEEHQLNTRDRLEIMAKICDAVHHAHQRSLIHRDLKPSNILVDENGQPKIVDFGVARVTDRDAQATSHTDAGQIIGTLAYMSPEQVLADPLELDTRSDVYALGVILYELLAARPPYEVGNQVQLALHAIREEDPPPLSSVSHTYRGDIETIVAKALEKDKARRYASAAELAADIRRYLTDEPIVARPPSLRYQLWKFARRHTALVGGVAAVFVVLAAGIVASTLQARQARRARDQATAAERSATQARDRALDAEHATAAERDRALQAEHVAKDQQTRAVAAEAQARQDRDKAVTAQQQADTEAAKTKALNDFLLKDLLQMANPMTQAQLAGSLTQPQSGQPNQRTASINPNLSVREALDRAAAGVEGKFDKQPLVEAAIRETIADIYEGMRIWPPAVKQMERVVALRTSAQGKDHRDTLQSRSNYASLLAYKEAEEVLKGIIEDGRRALGAADPVTRSAIAMLVTNYVNSHMFANAEAFLKNDVIPYDRRVLGEDAPTTLSDIFRLMKLYAFDNWQPLKYAEAETFLKGVMAEQTSKLGPKNRAVLTSMSFLARVYVPQNRYKDIIDLLEPAVRDESVPDVVRGGRASLEQHSYLPAMIGMLAAAYSYLGNSARADALMRDQSKLLDVTLSTPLAAESLEAPLISMTQLLGNSIWNGGKLSSMSFCRESWRTFGVWRRRGTRPL
jgi:non-specific serine/threonine protein kinase/serine/threonine-protein kinase